jgi:IS4 transposase
LDLRGSIPVFVHVTGGQVHDLHFLDELFFEPGAFYIMDKGYTDFGRLYRLHQERAYFVIRAKKNLVSSRQYSRPVTPGRGIRSDQIIRLTGPKTCSLYPEPLRRVHYFDSETAKRFFFLTNNTKLAPSTIAQLYHCRWQIELFFKWIKQHLRIKSFFGTSANAVKTQVWIAISIYVLVAIMKKEFKIDRSMYEILQVLSITLFEKVPISKVLTETALQDSEGESRNQLWLFDF